jgi:hypothetical protein
MNSMRSILLLVLVVAVAVSCSRLPQSTRSNDEMASIRAEYLQNNPDGKFNDHIKEGRVVKGMNTMEVLASWGIPNVRRGWEQDKTEYWTYYAKDEHTQQLMSYDLVFDDRVLNRWVIGAPGTGLGTTSSDVSSMGTVEETLRLGASSPMSGGTAGTQKK